jgi:ABC-type cobalt transport system substrate-binding protein
MPPDIEARSPRLGCVIAIAFVSFAATILIAAVSITSAINAATRPGYGAGDRAGCGVVLWVVNPLLPLFGLLVDGKDASPALFLCVAAVGSFSYACLIGWFLGVFRPKRQHSETQGKNDADP